MFTGIIQGIALIISIKETKMFCTHFIKLPKKLLPGLTFGSSLSYNGCCLTVKSIKDQIIGFDISKETLNVTTLSNLKCGDLVNVERAAKFNDEINGHLMSGHIFSKIEIDNISHTNNNYQLYFKINDSRLTKYIFYKGFIGIDGISLTINNILTDKFSVNLIPETIKRTTLSNKKVGELVNIEIDFKTQSIVDTVYNFLINKNNFQKILKN